MNSLLCACSIGEALDKLTILQIKLDFIKDKRRDDVQREYDDLRKTIGEELLQKDFFHYQKLLEVNLIMWNIQDELHSKSGEKDREFYLMKQLAVENQRRFRLKKILNHNLGSLHKEQKGYAQKRCFILPHLGLGDIIFINGAVRFLTTLFDEVVLTCKKQYENNVRTLFADEPYVTLHIVDDDKDISPNFGCPPAKFQDFIKQFNAIFLLGYHGKANVENFPYCFYDDIGISRDVMKSWAHFPIAQEIHEFTTSVFAKYKDIVFCHMDSSNAVFSCPVNPDSVFTINPSRNLYPLGHPYYEDAQQWVNKPFAWYYELLQKCKARYFIDSSFFCAALTMGLPSTVWPRNGRTYKHVDKSLNEMYTSTA
jgi:hypothetical protein